MLNFEQLNELIAKAKAENPIANAAATHIANRTAQMRKDQIEIQNNIRKDYESDNSVHAEMSGEALTKKVLKYLETEKQNMLFMNASDDIKNNSKWQIRSNKMSLIIDRTINSINDPTYLLGPSYNQEFYDKPETLIPYFVEGGKITFPDYDFNYPLLGTNTFWGSNRATIFSNLLLSERFTTTTETIADHMHRSIAHVSDSELSPDIVNTGSKYIYNVNGITGFGFTTGGYAFGGSRTEKLLAGKEFCPEDCSTFVAKITQSKIPYTTLDQQNAYRMLIKKGFVDESWLKSPIVNQFKNYTAITTEPPKAGDIYVLRKFQIKENISPDDEIGLSGHTAIVIGQDPIESHKVVTVGLSRNMEIENPEAGIWGKASAGAESYSTIPKEKQGDKHALSMIIRPNVSD